MKDEYKSLVDDSFKEAKDFEKSAFVVPYDVARKLEAENKALKERCSRFASKLYKTRGERNELRKEIEGDNAELDTAWSKVVELNDRVKMLEDIVTKHTSIPKAVIPMLTTKFPEIVQSEITHYDPNSTEVKELIEKCKPYFDYNTDNEILTLHQNNIE